jgi:hypothetical protein
MIVAGVKDFDRLSAELKEYPKALPLAASRAINEAIRKSRTQIGRAVREVYAVKQKDLYKTFRMNFSVPGTNPSGNLTSVANRFPMFVFGVVARKTQNVVVKIRTGTAVEVQHAFMAIMDSGHVGIFERYGNKRRMLRGHYIGYWKQPIREMFTGAASEMINATRSEKLVMEAAEEAFTKAVNRQITYWLAKGKADKEEPDTGLTE